ncbi:MAG: DUF5317 domain-containing protein [Atribacterota bacterium]
MLYLIIIILAVIIGLIRGGELENLYHISIEGVYLFAVALLLRGLIWFFTVIDFSFLLNYNPVFLFMSYFLLIAAALQNMKMPGFKYITLGVLMNTFVILVNGGKMPVLINQQMIQEINGNTLLGVGQNAIHSLKSNETLFAFLGDVISIPKPFPGASIISVGDIMIFIGLFILIQKTMMKEDILS